ncbi:hypothetical protein Tco_0411116 [Tanacetum coccineum]
MMCTKIVLEEEDRVEKFIGVLKVGYDKECMDVVACHRYSEEPSSESEGFLPCFGVVKQGDYRIMSERRVVSQVEGNRHVETKLGKRLTEVEKAYGWEEEKLTADS